MQRKWASTSRTKPAVTARVCFRRLRRSASLLVAGAWFHAGNRSSPPVSSNLQSSRDEDAKALRSPADAAVGTPISSVKPRSARGRRSAVAVPTPAAASAAARTPGQFLVRARLVAS